MNGAAYTISILITDGRKTLKHVKIQKPQRWDDEPSDVKERAEAAADRWISEYPDHVISSQHEWPGNWEQLWTLEPA
jgi:hypothetical protein